MTDGVPDYKVAARYGVSRATLYNWKQCLLKRGGCVSAPKAKNSAPECATKETLEVEISKLQKEIQHLQMERDALEKATEILKKSGASI